MYPLSMQLESGIGFAVANDEAEHAALSEMGYGPKLEKQADEPAKRGPGRPRKD